MIKTIALIRFHGANFGNVYEKGKEYYLEGAKAQALALRGLVKILTEEAPIEKKDANLTEQTHVETVVKTTEPTDTTAPKEEVVEQEKVQEETVQETPITEEGTETNESATEEKPKRGRKSTKE